MGVKNEHDPVPDGGTGDAVKEYGDTLVLIENEHEPQ